MDCVIDVAGRSDKLAQAMVVFVLSAGCGNHASIITSAAHGFTEETRAEIRCISDSRTGKWRELAQKTPECGDTQHRRKLQNVVTDSTAGCSHPCESEADSLHIAPVFDKRRGTDISLSQCISPSPFLRTHTRQRPQSQRVTVLHQHGFLQQHRRCPSLTFRHAVGCDHLKAIGVCLDDL